MPANLLIFDADYVSELTARMNTACGLFAEAVMSLQGAVNHENWKCKERAVIADEFDELNQKLGRLDSGVNETTRILGGSVSRFSALESQYESQANDLSDELTSSHGFTASVRTGGQSYSGRNSRSNESENSARITGAAGAAGAGALGSAAGQQNENSHSGGRTGTRSHSGMGGVHIHAGGNIFSRRTNADNHTESGAYSGHQGAGAMGGGGMMNVNLPVTHIPDNPGAAAKGTKDAQAIADAALSSVAGAITEALAGENSNGISLSSLNEAYNAGKSIFDSSSAIMANPSQPHTSERLTIAAGLVRLVQGTGKLQGVSVSSSESFTRNAGIISSALQNNSEASELRSVLDALSGSNTGSVSASGSNNRSFFDMIIEEIKKAFSGGNENVSSKTLASSSSVMDFLGNFVMDQAV